MELTDTERMILDLMRRPFHTDQNGDAVFKFQSHHLSNLLMILGVEAMSEKGLVSAKISEPKNSIHSILAIKLTQAGWAVCMEEAIGDIDEAQLKVEELEVTGCQPD